MNSSESSKTPDVGLWLAEYGDEMYSWAYYKTSDKEIAEDLVQDTFLSAHSNISKFKQDSNPKTWLFTILNNKIIDHYRSAVHRRSVNASSLSENDEPNNLFEKNESWNANSITQWEEPHLLDNLNFIKVLDLCIDHLPEKYKAVTLAKYYHHKKGEEICKDLDISASNLWQMVHRAKLQLKACLDKNWSNE